MNTGGMNPEVEYKINTPSKVVLAIALILILFPSFLSVMNIQVVTSILGIKNALIEKRVGEVTQTIRDVRKKTVTQTAFIATAKNEPVYRGDSILTAKDSSTRIILDDDSTIEIAADSLVKIDFVDEFSWLGVKPKMQVVVNQGNAVVKAKNRVIELQTPDGKRTIVAPSLPAPESEAPATAANTKGDAAEPVSLLDSDDSVNPLIMKAPENRIQFATTGRQENSGIRVSWTDLSAVAPMPYRVTYTINGTSKTAEVNQNTYLIPVSEETSKVSWKVEAKLVNDREITTTPQSLTNILPSPMAVFPQQNAIIKASQLKGPKHLLIFTWKEVTCPQFQFQLAKDAKFGSMVADQKTPKSRVLIPIATKGDFYWKVQCHFEGGTTSSEVRKFTY